MTFQEIINYAKSCVMEKYAKFDGRARRAEYWSFALCSGVISSVLNLLGKNGGFFSVLAYLFSLAILVPGLAVLWRRMHDIGKKGTWGLISLVPIVGWILVIVWCCRDSVPGANEYGPNPKGVS